MAAKKKVKVTCKFSGKPEDIWRLIHVQRRLMQIGQEERGAGGMDSKINMKPGKKSGKK